MQLNALLAVKAMLAGVGILAGFDFRERFMSTFIYLTIVAGTLAATWLVGRM